MILSRRSFLGGLLAAPIIVRPGILMPVRSHIVRSPLLGECRVIQDGEAIVYMTHSRRCEFLALLRPELQDVFDQAYGDVDRWREMFA